MLAVLIVVVAAAGCATGGAFGRAEGAARAGDWDTAVEYYRQAVQENPSRVDYQIALERAMLSASIRHLDQARVLEARGQFEDALREYRRASEYDPTNRQIAGKVIEMERRLRDLAEASRPQPTIQQLQQGVRQSPEPLLNPASRDPIDIVFNNASLRDILNSMGMSAGINVTFERDYADRSYSVQMRGVTFEQALNQILAANQLFYKVINERTIMVIPDNAQKRALYEEQVIRTFFISNADATEVAQILNGVVRIPALAVAPQIVANKTNNTITVRASANIVQIIQRVVEQNDNPKAEIVLDVQILEVNRGRAKQFGIDLSQFAINAVFSPETDPRVAEDAAATLSAQPFNLNTITRGISTADFYLAVPAAVVRFLESDTESRLIAKPQLRGAEGQQITLNLGDEIPVPTTVFTPVAQGGANFNPLTSFNYRPVGVNIQVTPRVTFDGDIILDLTVENSTLGPDIIIAGQSLPSFGSRRIQTRLRLRDGESNLMAGLLREEERRALRGIPGLLRLPVLRSLFASNDNDIRQTDIIMLLTPRIVRTQELTFQDVSPIFIGSQQSLGLGGPPPLIAAPAPAETAPAQPGVPAGPTPAAPPPGIPGAGLPGAPGPGGVSVVPPGSSQTPGTTAVPFAPAQPLPVAPPATLAPPSGPPGAPAGGAPPVAVPTTSSGGQILLSPPGPEFLAGAGPYTVPVSIVGASQISSVTLTITFNPSALRVRAVQEGSFMRTGGVDATFTQQVDAAGGRIDIAIVRSGDQTGVAGTGLLAAVVFDAVGGGAANLAVTGAAAAPRGTPVPLQFGAVTAVTVK
ncbi:MAG: secretin N-terminal domain-containing protein [Vicinamibacterales bacterium]